MINEKLNILSNILGPYKNYNKEYIFFCPKCSHHKMKFSINIEKNKCHCWVCSYAFDDLSKLLKQIGDIELIKKWEQIDGKLNGEIDLKFLLENGNNKGENVDKRIDFVLPDEYVSLIDNNSKTSILVRNYLSKRNVNRDDIIKWRIGYAIGGLYDGRVIIPSFNVNGNVEYFVARTYKGQKPNYKNPPVSKDIIFNELWVDYRKNLQLVEGVFDAIVAGNNSIPILGSFLSENSKLVKKIIKNRTTVYLALDPDAFEKEKKIASMLLKYDIRVYKIEINPFKDPGSMCKQEFQKRKENAILLNDNFYNYWFKLKLGV